MGTFGVHSEVGKLRKVMVHRPELSLQRLTPTTEGLYVPDVDTSLDEQAAKTQFWKAFKVVGSWWAELPPY